MSSLCCRDGVALSLADAIRLGATLRPQGFGAMFTPGDGTSCALGAAYEAIFGRVAEDGGVALDALIARYPVLLAEAGACPHAPCDSEPVWPVDSLAVHLNDFHAYSREQVAACIEGFEIGRMRQRKDQ